MEHKTLRWKNAQKLKEFKDELHRSPKGPDGFVFATIKLPEITSGMDEKDFRKARR